MELCYSLVEMADKLVLLRDWQKSERVRIEKKLTETMWLEIYKLFENGELKVKVKNEYIYKENKTKYYA